MDLRSRLLGLAVFGAFAAVLVWGAFSLQQAARRTEIELAKLTPPDPPRTMLDRRQSESLLPMRGDSSSGQQADLLRTQVDKLSTRLSRLSELLEQKTADYNALKVDFDRNSELLLDVLSSGQNNSGQPTEKKDNGPDARKRETDAATLAELNAELRAARAELAALEKEAVDDELQIFDLEERRRYLETAATGALVESGAAAVPSLIDLLADRRSEIRRWAATLLGEIGPNADTAVDALHEALSDSDESVRAAARKALRRIE